MNPTGEQYRIDHGPYSAVITEVGATLRSLTHEGRDLITTFGEDEAPAHSQGAQLLPWPNRIRDGRYVWGDPQQLPINESARNNASHGLVRDKKWTLESHEDAKLVQTLHLGPEEGWPGSLDIRLSHLLIDGGLRVHVTVHNDVNSDKKAMPFGYGAHPYIVAANLDETEVCVPSTTMVTVDDRMLPTGTAPVEGTPYDLRRGAPLGDLELDTAYTHLPYHWTVRIGTTHVWGNSSMRYVQLYTPGERDCIAVEPMSCAADAFNLGADYGLITLQPGASWTGAWGIGVMA